MAERDKYRDNDDLRGISHDRTETNPDTKSEARGDARDNVGNHSRGTPADPTGPEGNEQMRNRPVPDKYDSDLARDNKREAGRRNDEISES
jgi:hypothetical protein